MKFVSESELLSGILKEVEYQKHKICVYIGCRRHVCRNLASQEVLGTRSPTAAQQALAVPTPPSSPGPGRLPSVPGTDFATLSVILHRKTSSVHLRTCDAVSDVVGI